MSCCTTGQPCVNGLQCNTAGLCQVGSPSSQTTQTQPLTPIKQCGDGPGIDTAIGCIPVLTDDNGASFMGFVLKWSVGVGGGIAFLLILYASFMIMTSQGNPERLKAGQELLTSAISGLILLILSIFILKFIGVDILKLDTFGFSK